MAPTCNFEGNSEAIIAGPTGELRKLSLSVTLRRPRSQIATEGRNLSGPGINFLLAYFFFLSTMSMNIILPVN